MAEHPKTSKLNWLAASRGGTHPPDNAIRALRLRGQDRTYERIGLELGISKGAAHHLVQDAEGRCLIRVNRVARAPGRDWEPTKERAEELLARLRYEFEEFHAIASAHLDSPELELEFDAFAARHQRLADLATRSGGRKPRLATTVKSLCATYDAMLESAWRSCETTRGSLDPTLSAAAFRRDAEELARIISPRAKVKIEPVDTKRFPTGSPRPLGRGARKASAAERERRNQEIVLARLSGASPSEIAERFGVTDRTVRAVMEEWRSTAPPISRRTTGDLGEEIRSLIRKLHEEIEVEDDLDGYLDQLLEITRRLSGLAEHGFFPSPGWGGRDEDPEDRARRLNANLRSLLESTINEELMTEVADLVIQELAPENLAAEDVQP